MLDFVAFFLLLYFIDLQMACFGPSLNNPPPPLNKKMLLAKPTTVSNFERLNTLCVGVMVDPVICFFCVFIACRWRVSDRP